MKKAAVYYRVSTDGQTTENQRLAVENYCRLQNWKIGKSYEDVGISGAQDRRAGLDALKAAVVKGGFQVVVVWKFDRLARSTTHLLETLALLQRYGIDFVSVTEAVDTSTPAGRVLFTLVAAFGEFERSLIQERVVAGLARAKAEGKKLGRPRIGLDIGKALDLRQQGWSFAHIGKELGTTTANVFRQVTAVVSKTPILAAP
jgi:DNA invertase Pin-like site-specific DNA recombinase